MSIRSSPPPLPYPLSPLKQQESKGTRTKREPCQLTLLDGPSAGKKIDLGVQVTETSERNAATWEDNGGDHIRVGHTFKKLEPTTWSVKLVFYSLQHDVSPLAEAVKQTLQLTPQNNQPPRCLWRQGLQVARPVDCTSVQVDRKHPFPKVMGFKYAEVSIELKMAGGVGNPNSTGMPLCATYLTDYEQTVSEQERGRRGQAAATKTLLSPTIGEKASDQLVGLIDGKKQNDPAAIAKLDSRAFIQGTAAGIFSKKTLEDPKLQEKLKKDLAQTLAFNEPGVGIHAAALARALESGNPAGLPPEWQQRFPQLKKNQDVMLDAMKKQDFTDKTLQPGKNPGILNAVNRNFKDGLALRQVGAPSIAEPTKEDAVQLTNINNVLKDGSDDAIKKAFGITTESQLRALKNAGPYTSMEQFIQDAGRGGAGISGYSLWHTYAESQKASAKPEEAKVPAPA